MYFKNRKDAGTLLAKKLKKYKSEDTVVYALPRGGVVTGELIANYLKAPMDLIITRKIGYPFNPEIAIGAVSENGELVGLKAELNVVNQKWLNAEIKQQIEEANRRRTKYLSRRDRIDPKGKTVILVDDGVATGLTLYAAIKEINKRKPKKLIVAVPVIPEAAYWLLRLEADEVIALDVPTDDMFLGAVSSYYSDFPQVEDKEVIEIINKSKFTTNTRDADKGIVWQ